MAIIIIIIIIIIIFIIVIFVVFITIHYYCYQDEYDDRLGKKDAILCTTFLVLRRIPLDVVINVHRFSCKNPR